jgi:DedD protein
LPAATARGRYAVNFGSYGKVDNANALVAELKRAGIAAHTERVDLNGQAGLRVRAGPYVDRAQAERVRLAAKRARANLSASVVEIDDSLRADVPAAAVGATATGWAVQVGAFQAEADAKARRDKLRGAGFTAFTDTVRAEKGTLYRVRVGPEAQRANAERLRDALKARLQIDGIVVPHP